MWRFRGKTVSLLLKRISSFPLLSRGHKWGKGMQCKRFGMHPKLEYKGGPFLYNFRIYRVYVLTFLTPLPLCVLFLNSWSYLRGSIFLSFLDFRASVCLRYLMCELVCWYTCICVETDFKKGNDSRQSDITGKVKCVWEAVRWPANWFGMLD